MRITPESSSFKLCRKQNLFPILEIHISKKGIRCRFGAILSLTNYVYCLIWIHFNTYIVTRAWNTVTKPCTSRSTFILPPWNLQKLISRPNLHPTLASCIFSRPRVPLSFLLISSIRLITVRIRSNGDILNWSWAFFLLLAGQGILNCLKVDVIHIRRGHV